MKKQIKMRVEGKVQGVFFRKFTKDTADQLGVAGKVRNENDGSVYIEASGEQDPVDELVAACHRGPQNARVTAINVEPLEVEYPGSGFVIER